LGCSVLGARCSRMGKGEGEVTLTGGQCGEQCGEQGQCKGTWIAAHDFPMGTGWRSHPSTLEMRFPVSCARRVAEW
jgi:hypothetical protein